PAGIGELAGEAERLLIARNLFGAGVAAIRGRQQIGDGHAAVGVELRTAERLLARRAGQVFLAPALFVGFQALPGLEVLGSLHLRSDSTREAQRPCSGGPDGRLQVTRTTSLKSTSPGPERKNSRTRPAGSPSIQRASPAASRGSAPSGRPCAARSVIRRAKPSPPSA